VSGRGWRRWTDGGGGQSTRRDERVHKTESVSCRGVPLPPTVRLGVLRHWRRADDGAADFVCYRNETAPCASAAAKSTGAGAAGGARRAGRPCPQCYPGFQCVIIGTTRPAFLHRRRPDEPPVITTSSRIPSILRFFRLRSARQYYFSPLRNARLQ